MNSLVPHSDQQPKLTFTDHGGNGMAVLLLHGVTRCGDDWAPFLPALKSFRVITLDHRGHGTSERAASYLVSDYVADTIRFMRENFTEPMIVVGHSLGAMVAASVAAELPQLVRAIALEDPPFHTMGNRIGGSPWQLQFIGMQKSAAKGGSIQQIADCLADIRLPQADGGYKRLGALRDRASLIWSAECLKNLDPAVLTPIIEGRWLDGYQTGEILSRISCPTLLLQADPACGGALTDADCAAAMGSIARCEHRRFPGFGHQLHRDCGQLMGRTLQEFLATCLGNG